jgi:hypothetical protein
MKKFCLTLLMIIPLLAFSQIKTATVQASKRLIASEKFIWQGDTIQKDSIAYVEIQGDSIRLKYINGQFTQWLWDFGIRSLGTNKIPYKYESEALKDSPIQTNGTNVGIGKFPSAYKLDVDGTGHYSGNVKGDQNIEAGQNVIVGGHAGTSEFQSGFTGSGWQIDSSASGTMDNLTVRKSLKAYELVIEKIRSVNGGLVVSAANAKVDSVVTAGSSYTIYPEDSVISFVVNDIVRCQTFTGTAIRYYSGLVDATGSGFFTMHVIEGSDAPAAGDEQVQFGNTTDVSRQGIIYITATDDGAPYIDVLTEVNSTNLAGKTKVRLGKLSGITTSQWGALSGNGIWVEDNGYFQNVNVSGSITVTGGNAATQDYADGAASTAETNAVNTAASDATIKANAAQANAQAYADLVAGAAETNSNNYTDALENSLGDLSWEDRVSAALLDETVITGGYIKTSLLDANYIRSSIINTTYIEGLALNFTLGTIGGWNIYSSALYKNGATAAESAGLSPADYPFYAGSFYADRATAPFRVQKNGSVNASNINITGGLLSGWTINSSALYKNGATASESAGLSPADYPFYAGSFYSDRATAPFRVSAAGSLTATNANITGQIASTSGNISIFKISGTYLYTGESPFADNSVTLGLSTSSSQGFIDLRGPSGGSTYNLIYAQAGNIQHQLGEFLAADIRARGTTWFPSTATIQVDHGVSYDGTYAGETSGRYKLWRASSTSINLETVSIPYYGIDLNYIVYVSSSDGIIYLPTTEAGGRVIGKEYRIMREQGVTLTVSTNNASTYIKYGANSTAVSIDLANARDEYIFIWDGIYWQYHVISRG